MGFVAKYFVGLSPDRTPPYVKGMNRGMYIYEIGHTCSLAALVTSCLPKWIISSAKAPMVKLWSKGGRGEMPNKPSLDDAR